MKRRGGNIVADTLTRGAMRDMTGENAGPPNLMGEEDVLRLKLDELRSRHRALDDAIAALEVTVAGRSSLDLRRLKKQKLALKDEIRRLSDILTPDIIA